MPANTITPPWSTLFTTMTSPNRLPTRHHTWSVKFSKITLEAAYGREINITFSGKSSGGHSCSQHANCMLPFKLETSVALCYVTKQHILEWPSVPSTRCLCVRIMFNQLVDMPHLSDGWIILARDKSSVAGM
jgi:hypothetical protein